jgi:hypothetical protein
MDADMAKDFSFERSLRLPLRELIHGLCCAPLSFMFDNYLLAPRDEWFSHSDEKFSLHLRMLIGMRVIRGFMFLKRDQVLYKCPFCGTDLVSPVGFINPDSESMMAQSLSIGRAVPTFTIPKSTLERELNETIRRCRGVWPPND